MEVTANRILATRACPVCNKNTLRQSMRRTWCSSCNAYSRATRVREMIDLWARDKWLVIYIPIWLFFAWTTWRLWQDPMIALQRLHPLYGINFGIHELGHILWIPFGAFMSALGGSLTQLLFALLALVGFWQLRALFAMAMGLVFVGTNFIDIGVYAADAQYMELPLGGWGAIANSAPEDSHDWYNILGDLGWTHSAPLIGDILKGIGYGCCLAGLVVGIWLLTRIAVREKAKTSG